MYAAKSEPDLRLVFSTKGPTPHRMTNLEWSSKYLNEKLYGDWISVLNKFIRTGNYFS